MKQLNNTDPSSKEFMEELILKEKMAKIKNKLLVLSGKGGVGKSSVAANLAVGLSLEGYNTGLIDIDIHGPSIPKMLNLENQIPEVKNNSIQPVKYSETLKIMSISFLMQDPTEAIIWRGPLKMNVIKQFLYDVDWGELDFLIVDSPPGTGDEPLSICQLIQNPDYAIIVTTPQEIALNDVRKSIKFCDKLECKILGIIENMSGFICPHCNETVDIFKVGGGFKMAKELNLNFLGAIPIEQTVVNSADEGKPFVHFYPQSEATKRFKDIIKIIIDHSNH